MATRDWSEKYFELRRACKPRVIAAGRRGTAAEGLESLLPSPGQGLSDAAVPTRRHVLPPVWVDTVDAINSRMTQIQGQLAELASAHQHRLKVTFENAAEAHQDREIEIQTRSITRMFKECERDLKRIATIGSAKDAELPYQERVVRVNVMRALASKVGDLSKKFRQEQKRFLLELERQKNKEMDFGFGTQENKEDLSLEYIDRSLNPEQLAELEQREEQSDEREQEIAKIAKSVRELAEIFNELQVLVIEQGTILDRIDYHVESALQQAELGAKDVQKAENYQKKNRSVLCVIFLLMMAAVFTLIIILRKN